VGGSFGKIKIEWRGVGWQCSTRVFAGVPSARRDAGAIMRALLALSHVDGARAHDARRVGRGTGGRQARGGGLTDAGLRGGVGCSFGDWPARACGFTHP